MTRALPTEPPTVLVLLALGDYGSRMLAGTDPLDPASHPPEATVFIVR